jgi:antitoxin component YwqK of YwqJK toxin-antitoxin module
MDQNPQAHIPPPGTPAPPVLILTPKNDINSAFLKSNFSRIVESSKYTSERWEGRLYYPSGTIQYQGGIKRNTPHGIGIHYYANGNICYKGYYSKGRRNGGGIYYYDNGGL